MTAEAISGAELASKRILISQLRMYGVGHLQYNDEILLQMSEEELKQMLAKAKSKAGTNPQDALEG